MMISAIEFGQLGSTLTTTSSRTRPTSPPSPTRLSSIQGSTRSRIWPGTSSSNLSYFVDFFLHCSSFALDWFNSKPIWRIFYSKNSRSFPFILHGLNPLLRQFILKWTWTKLVCRGLHKLHPLYSNVLRFSSFLVKCVFFFFKNAILNRNNFSMMRLHLQAAQKCYCTFTCVLACKKLLFALRHGTLWLQAVCWV